MADETQTPETASPDAQLVEKFLTENPGYTVKPNVSMAQAAQDLRDEQRSVLDRLFRAANDRRLEEEAQGSGSARYDEDGSGSGRYGHNDWTAAGMDATGFPVGPGTYHPHVFSQHRPLTEDGKIAEALKEKYPDPQDRINAHQEANQPGDRSKK